MQPLVLLRCILGWSRAGSLPSSPSLDLGPPGAQEHPASPCLSLKGCMVRGLPARANYVSSNDHIRVLE